MVILFMAIGDYSIMVIGGYSIYSYWWLFYYWLSVTILLLAINGYSINGYWLLFY
jgi:hypothetical protein